MLINEASKLTNLTKKAIEYYTVQGLVVPTILSNGYREYSKQDINILNEIAVLRKLDISTEEIKFILCDKTNQILRTISLQKQLDLRHSAAKLALFQKLSLGNPYAEIAAELEFIEKEKTITKKLLDAFPGYYGQFICLHFSRFLNEPIQSEAQQAAYNTIITFLDNMPAFDIPKDLEDYLIEGTKHIGTQQMSQILENTKKSIANPDMFFLENKEVLEQYLAYKQSDEYKLSPAFKLMELMKNFNNASGYNDIFIPEMKKLSSSYAQYYSQLEIANEKLLSQYPQISKLNN